MDARSTPSDELLRCIPVLNGHFLLESGLHTDRWFVLDALFLDPVKASPFIDALAELIRPSEVTAVCGPLLGGAFLAQAVASRLNARFYYSTPAPGPRTGSLFSARYALPEGLSTYAKDERFALVDDAISAGSSVRATEAALFAEGSSIVIVGSLLTLGDVALQHFSSAGIPVATVVRRDLRTWEKTECPLCRVGMAVTKPDTA